MPRNEATNEAMQRYQWKTTWEKIEPILRDAWTTALPTGRPFHAHTPTHHEDHASVQRSVSADPRVLLYRVTFV